MKTLIIFVLVLILPGIALPQNLVAPVISEPEAVSDTSALITWNYQGTENPDGFEVWDNSFSNSFPNGLLLGEISGTERELIYIFPNCDIISVGNARVRAFVGSDSERIYSPFSAVTQSTVASFPCGENPPKRPSDVSAVVEQENVLVSWTDNSDNESGFKVFRMAATEEYYEEPLLIETVDEGINEFREPTLGLAGGVYAYIIIAYNDYGSAENSFSENVYVPSGITDIEVGNKAYKFTLNQNYPNPFNPSTVISYAVEISGDVKIAVYDILGNEVAVLVNQHQTSGEHQINFDASDLPSGMYIYSIRSGNYFANKQMLLVK